MATAPAPMVDADELAMVAAAPPGERGRSLTRLGPLPPLQMDPTGGPVLAEYRELALTRYGQHVTAAEAAWSDVALTLVLRFADVGIATYGSLRIVGDPERTVTWVVEETAAARRPGRIGWRTARGVGRRVARRRIG